MESLSSLLENIAEELPIIRPISEFIHLNLLLPYQHVPFWEALKAVSLKFEAMPFHDQGFYRNSILRGEIPKDRVIERLEKSVGDDAHPSFDKFMTSDFKFIHHDHRTGRLHYLWHQTTGINISQMADGMLIKWLSMYLDQGISLWSMPGADEGGFYETVRDLLNESYVLPSPFKRKDFKDIFPPDPDQAIQQHLNVLCPDKKFRKEYLRESIMTLRGWAGLIYSLEKNRELFQFPRKIILKDFIALKLILERAWLSENDIPPAAPEFHEASKNGESPFTKDAQFEVFQACHEILEESIYQKFLADLKNLSRNLTTSPAFQAVFCMDDRECSLRRYLEDCVPGTETLGTAGHYGIECLYQHDEDAFPKKQCPAPVTPKYFIKETTLKKYSAEDQLSPELIRPSHSLEDVFQSFSGAIKSTALLAKNLFFPLAFKDLKNVREINSGSDLKFIRSDRDPLIQGLKPGYSLDEMTDLVFQQLSLIGFVKGFSSLVFIVGHGSNSQNNPYFATYGCGACSGRPGSANARTFVKMANHREVRNKLKEKYSLMIPDSTYFVAAFHDTCRDVVDFFDTYKIPAELSESFQTFKSGMSEALYKNAEERVKSFKSVTRKLSREEAQKEVIRRSFSLFETRPELGHTNVAFAVVGKRDLTKGLDLNRRSFLQSYDRDIDPSGEILAASLSAVIPVTSGISLDYYFSKVDNLRFGAGSKLPQNIVGNFGLSHGTESDLLCGLPFQMIDQHTPLRLFILVEQSPEVALKAIQGNQLVRDIVYNYWVHYGCWDENSGSFYLFQGGEMRQLKMEIGAVC